MSYWYSTPTHVLQRICGWHWGQQHKLFLVSLPNHVLVSCIPAPWQNPKEKNQVVLSLVIWHAMWCTVILFRSILQGTVRLRRWEQCWKRWWAPPAVNHVTPQMPHNTRVEVEYRLDISRATNGSHVEVYGIEGKRDAFHSL